MEGEMAKKTGRVRIPWLVNDNEERVPHYYGWGIGPDDEGSGWVIRTWDVEPAGGADLPPYYQKLSPTHRLRWREQEDLVGLLRVLDVGRGRSAAYLEFVLEREGLKPVHGTMNVNSIPGLWPHVQNGRCRVTIGPRQRGKNYLFELVTVG